MPRTLKVYRTPIGFHDAYVAAPTQKAALEAWGSDANLFARGLVEVVTDPGLTNEPLAEPGKVIKRLRGTAEEHFEALPTSSSRVSAGKASADPPPAKKPAKAKPVAPRPSRAKVDLAEQAVDELEDRQRSTIDALDVREEALRRERRDLEKRHASERAKAEAVLAAAQQRYDSALGKWRAAG